MVACATLASVLPAVANPTRADPAGLPTGSALMLALNEAPASRFQNPASPIRQTMVDDLDNGNLSVISAGVTTTAALAGPIRPLTPRGAGPTDAAGFGQAESDRSAIDGATWASLAALLVLIMARRRAGMDG